MRKYVDHKDPLFCAKHFLKTFRGIQRLKTFGTFQMFRNFRIYERFVRFGICGIFGQIAEVWGSDWNMTFRSYFIFDYWEVQDIWEI